MCLQFGMCIARGHGVAVEMGHGDPFRTLQSIAEMGPVLSSMTRASSSVVDLKTCTTAFSPAVTMLLHTQTQSA